MVNKEALTIDIADKNFCVFKGSWISLTRPLTLTGTFSTIIVGTLFANNVHHIDMGLFIGLLLASLLIQSSVNMFNDYYDFKNGQDKDKWHTANNAVSFREPSFHTVKYIASLLLLFAMIIGLWLVLHSNIWVLFIGIAGMVSGIYYSYGKRSFSALGFGEIVAAIFLGIVPTNLAYMIQGNDFSLNVFLVSIVFGLLISTMILTNNIRDLKKDIGFRKTIAIRLGRKTALRLLAGILFSLYGLTCLLIIFQVLPWQTILVIMAIPVAKHLYGSIKRNIQIGYMKWIAWHHWLFSMLFVAGLLFAF
ncbi:MAG TPA: prenyltransferase [Bacillota bacterium]|nr:prenyltransferase [Bacillota bacterium]